MSVLDFHWLGTEGFETDLRQYHNYNATAAPTEDDDETLGYSKGSRWIFEGVIYDCLDASDGAAIWDRWPPVDYRRVVLHPTIDNPPEPEHLDGEWLYEKASWSE